MKKVLGLSSLALAGLLAVTGCSCGTKGVYKFEKLEKKVGDETKTFTCSTDDKKDADVALLCAGVEKTTYEFTKDKIIIRATGDEKEKGIEYEYKVEKKKVSVKDTGDKWTERGELKSGRYIITSGTGDNKVTYYYKK